MKRLYSSFDLDRILADDLARKDREKKEAAALVRREALAQRRAARKREGVAESAPVEVSGANIPAVPLITPVSVSLQALDLSQFRLGEDTNEYHLFGLPLGNSFVDLALTKEQLLGGAFHTQSNWRDHPEYLTIGEEAYDLPSGPELEAVVEVSAAYNPVDGEQTRLLVGLQKLVVADMALWVMTRSRVRFSATSRDDLSSDCGLTYVRTMNLKGPATPITSTSGLDAEFGILLATTPERYCAARAVLGVDPGMLHRSPHPRDGTYWPLSVGDGVYVDDVNHGPARGVRYLPRKGAGGRS